MFTCIKIYYSGLDANESLSLNLALRELNDAVKKLAYSPNAEVVLEQSIGCTGGPNVVISCFNSTKNESLATVQQALLEAWPLGLRHPSSWQRVHEVYSSLLVAAVASST